MNIHGYAFAIGGILAGLWPAALSFEICKIEAVHFTRAPRLDRHKLIYSVDIKFDKRPSNYWVFHEPRSQSLVVSCYDAAIKKMEFDFPPNTPFSKLTVADVNSRRSITGRQSEINITLDTVWHFESSPVESDMIRIVIWKNLEEKLTQTKHAANPYVLAGIVAAAAGIVSFGVIMLASGSSGK